MSSRLKEILEQKEREVARILPRAELLRAAALERNDFRGFGAAIDRGPDALGLIAEVKKASPSVGVITENFDPVQIAKTYESAGAHANRLLIDVRSGDVCVVFNSLVCAQALRALVAALPRDAASTPGEACTRNSCTP